MRPDWEKEGDKAELAAAVRVFLVNFLLCSG